MCEKCVKVYNTEGGNTVVPQPPDCEDYLASYFEGDFQKPITGFLLKAFYSKLFKMLILEREESVLTDVGTLFRNRKQWRSNASLF